MYVYHDFIIQCIHGMAFVQLPSNENEFDVRVLAMADDAGYLGSCLSQRCIYYLCKLYIHDNVARL